MAIHIERREFIALVGGTAAVWPLSARAQQPTPIVGLINGRSAQDAVRNVAAFRKGLDETGHVEGQNDGRVSLAAGPIRSPSGGYG